MKPVGRYAAAWLLVLSALASCEPSQGGPETSGEPSGISVAGCDDRPGMVTTIAGVELEDGFREGPGIGSFGDGGAAIEAAVDLPIDLAVDSAGNLYVLESAWHTPREIHPGRVRRIDGSGTITTVVGPSAGDPAVVGPAAQLVDIVDPWALALGPDDSIYVGGGNDGSYMVVRVDASGSVTTIAGTGKAGYSGDGGPAVEARLEQVIDLLVLDDGTVYLTDDFHVRRVDPSGIITTVAAGDDSRPADAGFDYASGLAIDAAGNIYFSDGNEGGNNMIRRIDPSGLVETVVGRGAGLSEAVKFYVDMDGSLVVADTGHHRIVRVDTDGTVETIAGTGEPGLGGECVPANEALFNEPVGVARGTDGAIYVADFANYRIRRIGPPTG